MFWNLICDPYTCIVNDWMTWPSFSDDYCCPVDIKNK